MRENHERLFRFGLHQLLNRCGHRLDVAQQKNVKIAPLAEKMNPKDETYYFDEIHLSDLGAMEAAKVIFESLKGILPKP